MNFIEEYEAELLAKAKAQLAAEEAELADPKKKAALLAELEKKIDSYSDVDVTDEDEEEDDEEE